MFTKKSLIIYIILPIICLIILYIEHITHIEFLLHLAAIPLDVLIVVFIVERFLQDREKKEKLNQLMYIKGYLFRSEMRNLFILNFKALKSPHITMAQIKEADLHELKRMRKAAEHTECKSPEMMEDIIMEYVDAQPVWQNFMERAINYNFTEIFQNMIYILQFINDVKQFKANNPDKLFIYEAQQKPWLMKKVNKVLGDGIRSFIDYAIELKEKQPDIFSEIISDYEMSMQLYAN
jgi:hypothetical protein